MARPDEFVLGGTQRIRAKFTDDYVYGVTPLEMRISLKDPLGEILTVSGGDLLVDTTTSGQFYFVYRPPLVGWYEYESWGKDGNGNEVVETAGFEIVDRLYP
jgi:hypothetical protein